MVNVHPKVVDDGYIADVNIICILIVMIERIIISMVGYIKRIIVDVALLVIIVAAFSMLVKFIILLLY